MKTIILSAAALCLLGACASVSDETISTINVDGERYNLRTRTVDGPDGPFRTTSAEVRGFHFLCKIDSPGDCAAAVRRGINELEDAGLDFFPRGST